MTGICQTYELIFEYFLFCVCALVLNWSPSVKRSMKSTSSSLSCYVFAISTMMTMMYWYKLSICGVLWALLLSSDFILSVFEIHSICMRRATCQIEKNRRKKKLFFSSLNSFCAKFHRRIQGLGTRAAYTDVSQFKNDFSSLHHAFVSSSLLNFVRRTSNWAGN